MSPRPLSGPDPSLPLSSATRVLRAGPDDAAFEADFADLAARFAAQSGGGLSHELSAELALEIVLNEVVEQACLATGATGAAIVLQRDGEMVCRASSGGTAPELGARLDATSGISGECIRTRQTQRCDDVLADLRADLEASQRLGVRSVMVMPLLRGEELAGVFELFSSKPYAFGVRDERTLEALAGRVLNNLCLNLSWNGPTQNGPTLNGPTLNIPTLNDQAVSSPLPGDPVGLGQISNAGQPYAPAGNESLPPTKLVASEPRGSREIEEESASDIPARRGVDFTTAVLAGAVIVCVALLGLLLGRHVGAQQSALRVRSVAAASKAAPNADSAANAVMPALPEAAAPRAQTAAGVTASSGKAGSAEIPAGSLLVYENGKEVFRQEPASGVGGGSQAVVGDGAANHAGRATPPPDPASEQSLSRAPEQSTQQSSNSPRDLTAASPDVSADLNLDANDVLRRVEPKYPADALQQKVQGPVVLDVRISPAGQVQAMTLVVGQPLLVQAAKDAVQQWQFKPRSVNGHPATMQARVTLNFRLPQ
jgi:TonB family protein